MDRELLNLSFKPLAILRLLLRSRVHPLHYYPSTHWIAVSAAQETASAE
jgi:hypothetical protein